MVHLLVFDFGDLQAGRFVEQVLPNGLCHQRIGDDYFDIHRQMSMENEGGHLHIQQIVHNIFSFNKSDDSVPFFPFHATIVH